MTDILVSNTLQRLHTLPTSRDPFLRWVDQTLKHYQGEYARFHYVAFTKKFPRGHSHPLDFSSLINTSLLPIGRVTNKTKSKEPRQPASVEQVPCLDPIDGPMAKPTTTQAPLINQLRVSHSTLMVVLLSQVVTQQTGPYGEVL
jgi:hypothetical protein